MCDKYKPTEADIKNSEKFFAEFKTIHECNKSCHKPSLLKRMVSAGVYARWWELLLLVGFGYLLSEFHLEVVSNAPAIVATLLMLWLASFVSRLR